jgi:hypothetical protein
VPINIKFIDRADYYTAFNEFNESGKTKIMESIIGKAEINVLMAACAWNLRKWLVIATIFLFWQKLIFLS